MAANGWLTTIDLLPAAGRDLPNFKEIRYLVTPNPRTGHLLYLRAWGDRQRP